MAELQVPFLDLWNTTYLSAFQTISGDGIRYNKGFNKKYLADYLFHYLKTSTARLDVGSVTRDKRLNIMNNNNKKIMVACSPPGAFIGSFEISDSAYL
jgi:hypothetical protein